MSPLHHASLVRLAVLTIWLTITCVTPYPAYAQFPDATFSPYGIGRLLEFLITPKILRTSFFLTVAKWSGIILLLLAICTQKRQWAFTVAAFVSVLVLDAVTKALGGFVNHGQAAPLFVLLVFALFGRSPFLTLGELLVWFRRRPGRQDRSIDYDGALWLARLGIIVPYTYIGLNRLVTGGTEVFTGDSILYYVGGTSHAFATLPWWLDFRHYPWVLKSGFACVTAFEALSAFTLLSTRFRVLWLVVITSLHVGTVFLMNILFWENIILTAVLFAVGTPRLRPLVDPASVPANATLTGNAGGFKDFCPYGEAVGGRG